MTLKSEGKVIYAGNGLIGTYYSSVKSGIVVKFLRIAKSGGLIFQSTETGNEISLTKEYLLREVNQKEVEKEMAKKEETKNGKEKKLKKSKVCIDYTLLAPFFKSGLPVKVKDLLEKVKVEKTSCSPYFRVYSTLERAKKEGILKFLGKGTFQLVGSNKKAEPKKEETKPAKTTNKPKAKAEPVKTPKEPENKSQSPEKTKEEAPL